MSTGISDPIALEVFRNRLVGVAEEMGEVMRRVALSPMIKERNDRSCAIFTPDMQLVAQAEHLPIHLALLVNIVPEALATLGEPLRPGDVCLHNDPYVGGSHLPDVTAVSAIFDDEGQELLGYCAVIAHHGDIGGASPGGVGRLTHDIVEEGLLIPPLLVRRGGEVVEDIMKLLKGNVRLPVEFEGDILAQIAALQACSQGVQGLARDLGAARYHSMTKEILAYSKARTRAALRALPHGEAVFVDVLDDDGMGNGPLPIRVRLRIDDDGVLADFAGSHPQLPAPVNASLAVTRSATFYAIRCLIDPSIPTTSGCFRLVSVKAPPASIVNAQSPAPVAGGSLETAQRIVDVLFGALAQLVPARIPAAGMGSHNTIAIGGFRDGSGERFVISENLSGGGGARPAQDGISARRVNLMNTPNTPVEVLERNNPVVIRRLSLREGSAGQGTSRGGLGLHKEYEFLQDCQVAILSDRSTNAPWGLFGGGSAMGSAHFITRNGGRTQKLPSKVELQVKTGDRLIAQTAGGAGYGPPEDRPHQSVEQDLVAGYLNDDTDPARSGNE